jgi:hypothetical protein
MILERIALPSLDDVALASATLTYIEATSISADEQLALVRVRYFDDLEPGTQYTTYYVYDVQAQTYTSVNSMLSSTLTGQAADFDVFDAVLVGNSDSWQLFVDAGLKESDSSDLILINNGTVADSNLLLSEFSIDAQIDIERIETSADGRFVALQTSSALLADELSPDTNDSSDIYLLDRVTGEITRVSFVGGAEVYEDTYLADLMYTGNELRIAFVTDAAYVSPSIDTNSSEVSDQLRAKTDAYVWSASVNDTGIIADSALFTLASIGSDETASGFVSTAEAEVQLTTAGLLFTSSAGTLVAGDNNASDDVFYSQDGSINRLSLFSGEELSLGAVLQSASNTGTSIYFSTASYEAGGSEESPELLHYSAANGETTVVDYSDVDTASFSLSSEAGQNGSLFISSVYDPTDLSIGKSSLMISSSNYAPIINIQAVDFTEDAGGLVADVSVAGRYTIADQDGDILTVTFNAASGHYTLDVVNQQVLLTQAGIDAVNAGDSLDAIDLKVSDGSLEGTASDTPVVTSANDPPSAASISVAEDEDATVAITLIGADIDVGDAIDGFTVTSLPSNGILYSDADLTSTVAEDDVLTATSDALTLYFKPTANWFGSTSFTFIATDGDVTSASATASISVASVNDLPAFSSATTSSVDENTVTSTVIYSAVASDVDGDEITYSLGDTDKDLLSIDATSGDVTLLASANYEAKDSYSFNVIATDSNSAAQTLAVTVSVNDLNDPSVVTGGTSGSGDEKATAVTGTLLVTDQDGLTDGSYFSVTTNPEHGSASIDEATGAWGYTPAANFNGNDSFTVTITDDAGYTKTQVIGVAIAAVNDTPTLANAISNQSVAEDSDFSFVVPAITFADVDAGDVLTLSATLSDGSALPGWLSFDDQTNTFSGTPLNADVGTRSVKVTATDIAGTSVSDTFDLVVTNTNDTPILANMISNQSVAEDSDFSFVIPANTFADIDAEDVLTLSATLSDGSALPGWLSFDDQTNTFSGTPLNADVGTRSVKVTATDIAGTSVSDTFDLVVTNTNDTPSGTVTISGIVTQGQTLTASNDLADADGLGTITYQWNRDGTAITDATDSTYVLSSEDVGEKITVTASYFDGHGTYEESYSSETDIVKKASISLFHKNGSLLTSGRIQFSDVNGTKSTVSTTDFGSTNTQILSAELEETTDGAVDISDVISQLRHIVGLSELTGLNKAAADNDANGSINISDVISSLRQIVGLQEAPNARIVDAQGNHQFLFDESVTELYVVAAGDSDLSWTPLELI